MTTSGIPETKGPIRRQSGGTWKRSALILGAVLLAVAYVQWPMFKGVYYRAVGAQAPEDGIAWRKDLAGALAESAQTGKPVLVDFWATWCPPCQVMKHETWPDARVAKMVNEEYIPVALDVDMEGNRGPAQEYSVQVIPTVLVLDSQGKVVRRANYLSAAQLRDFLGGKEAR